MPNASTQQFLEVDKIKEGVVVLRNKALRGILMVSSLNFALKSDDEQTATIFSFQNFLNSLDFGLEIVIQSKRLNITGYLEKLKELEGNQTNELLKIQTAEYQNFIKELISGGSIMSKNFFAIVPFALVELIDAPRLKGPKGFSRPAEEEGPVSATEERFQRAKTQLWQRMEFVALGLRRCGLQCAPLSTSELIELFWSQYHPEESEVGYYPELPPELIV